MTGFARRPAGVGPWPAVLVEGEPVDVVVEIVERDWRWLGLRWRVTRFSVTVVPVVNLERALAGVPLETYLQLVYPPPKGA